MLSSEHSVLNVVKSCHFLVMSCQVEGEVEVSIHLDDLLPPHSFILLWETLNDQLINDGNDCELQPGSFSSFCNVNLRCRTPDASS